MTSATPHSDIRLSGWIGRLREPWRSCAVLARLDRPVGTWLLFLPGLCGLFLAPTGAPFSVSLGERVTDGLLFAVGALAMRSAGCIVNDLWDRDIDAKVARTAARPLASGALTQREGLSILAVLLSIGALVLLCLPKACWALAPVALLLVALYPVAKRVTWWPQLMMGFTFGFGAPMGYAAAGGTIDGSGTLLYAGVILWQMGFDTIYGFQDMEDDARIGVRSTSRLMAKRPRLFVGACYVLALLAFGAAAMANRLTPGFWVVFAPVAVALVRQATRIQPANAPACLALFRQNVPIGIALALAFVLGRLGF